MRKIITYAIDAETGQVISRVGHGVAWPVLDFEGMTPENNFKAEYNLEKFDTSALFGTNLYRTKKIPLETKNLHRRFWGMPELKGAK
jgi:hypothetical protein